MSMLPSEIVTPPELPLPSNNTLPVPLGKTDMLPLDTDTISEMTGDVKVLFVKVCVPVKVTSPTLDGWTIVKILYLHYLIPLEQ